MRERPKCQLKKNLTIVTREFGSSEFLYLAEPSLSFPVFSLLVFLSLSIYHFFRHVAFLLYNCKNQIVYYSSLFKFSYCCSERDGLLC